MALKKFPQDIIHLSWNSRFKAGWTTTVQESASGRSRTMTNQLYPKWTITEQIRLVDNETADKLLGFYNLVKGQYESFLWYDHSKHHEENQTLQGSAGKYQAVIVTGEFVEYADYIENVTVYLNGTEVGTDKYQVSDGVITFSTAPSSTDVVTATYDYWWKVRFASSAIEMTRLFENLNNSGSFSMEVVR